MGYEHEKFKHCKLESKIAIAYSGLFLECFPKKSDLKGYILTWHGDLFYRKHAHKDWIKHQTPEVYLFRQLDCYKVLKVDHCERKIQKFKPKGRILDCSDHKLYEIQCKKWVVICDLNRKKILSTVQTIQIECDATSLEIPLSEFAKKVRYLPKLSDAEAFADVEIKDDKIWVTLKDEFTPPVGESVVLTYKEFLLKKLPKKWEKCPDFKGKKVLVSVIIKRVNSSRLSVFGGEIGPTSVPFPEEQQAITDAQLSLYRPQFISETLLAPIINWTPPTFSSLANAPLRRYMNPAGSLAANGEYTVPCDGDYDLDASFTFYLEEGPRPGPTSPDPYTPYILLWLQRVADSALIVLSAAPLGISVPLGSTQNASFPLIGKTSFTTGLSLDKGDILYFTYFDYADTIPDPFKLLRPYILEEVSTNWTIHPLGPKSPTPIIPPP